VVLDDHDGLGDQVVNRVGRDRRRSCRGGGVVRARGRPRAGRTAKRGTARLVPLTVDGLIYASSMVMLDSARRDRPVPAFTRWLLGLGIAATLAANVAHGLGPRPGPCRGHGVARGGAGRILRAAHDDHP
jgi:Protein of unknown function (DUF2637)